MSFAIYILGYVVFCCGVLYGMHLLRVPVHWMGVAALILLGLGIVTGVTSTRRRDV